MDGIDPRLADELLSRWHELALVDRFYIIGFMSATQPSLFTRMTDLIAKGLTGA